MRVVLVVLALSVPAEAIVLGQLETFSNDTHFWTGGTVVPNGGPAGAGDAYLARTSTTPSGNLALFNRAQWAGNYIAAGVTAVEADVVNLGPSDLSMRLFIGSITTGVFASKEAFVVPPGAKWHHAVFDLSASGLFWTGTGTDDLNAALEDAGSMGFRHQTGPPWDLPTPVAGSMGIDNIHAVPEPNSLVVASFVAALCLWRS